MAEWSSQESHDKLLGAFTSSNRLPTDTTASVQPYKIICEGNKNKFVCTTDDCFKIFRFKSEIERHIFTHSESRPFLCTFEGCERAFKRTNALQNHIRSQHTGEASLKCPFPGCELCFTTTAKLRYHKALHLDEKPYKCCFPGCGRAFVTFSQLKQHEKSPSVHLKKDHMTPCQTLNRLASASTTSEGSLDDEEREMIMMDNTTKKVKYNAECRSKEHFHFQLGFQKEIPQNWVFPTETDEIEKFFAKENNEENNTKGEKRALANVLSENEILKKELESTENLLDKIAVNLSQTGLDMLEDFQNRISSEYDENFVYKSSVCQGSFDSPTTQDVDAYFFDNENSKFGSLINANNNCMSGLYSYNGNAFYNEQNLFTTFTCENLSSLLFK
jgi:hypothetical protein